MQCTHSCRNNKLYSPSRIAKLESFKHLPILTQIIAQFSNILLKNLKLKYALLKRTVSVIIFNLTTDVLFTHTCRIDELTIDTNEFFEWLKCKAKGMWK